MRALFWVADLSLYPHLVEVDSELCGPSFIRALVTFMRALPSWPDPLPKTPPLILSHQAFVFPRVNLEDTQKFRP